MPTQIIKINTILNGGMHIKLNKKQSLPYQESNFIVYLQSS